MNQSRNSRFCVGKLAQKMSKTIKTKSEPVAERKMENALVTPTTILLAFSETKDANYQHLTASGHVCFCLCLCASVEVKKGKVCIRAKWLIRQEFILVSVALSDFEYCYSPPPPPHAPIPLDWMLVHRSVTHKL